VAEWRRADGKRTIRTARHEAAHAVCAEYFGIRCDRVELLGSFHGNTYLFTKAKATCFTQGVMVSAGSVAEQLWHRQPRTVMARGDRRVLKILFTRGRERAAVMSATEALVHYARPAVEAVARELKRRDLTGREVRKLMRSAGIKPGAAQR
jgi:hypothetical protein